MKRHFLGRSVHGWGSVVGSAVAAVASTCVILGCQSEYRNDSKKITAAYTTGDFVLAATTAHEEALEEKAGNKEFVVMCLEAGSTAASAGHSAESIAWLDRAYEQVRPYLDSKAEARATEAVITTLVNQTMSVYKATTAERIWLNTLQALNYLRSGQLDDARTELRRAYEWQQNAAERYANEIEAGQKAASQQDKGKAVGASGEVANDPHYENLGSMVGYADFVNPFTTWLTGVYLLSCGVSQADFEESRGEFVRTKKLIGDAAGASLMTPTDLAASRAEGSVATPMTFVAILDGIAPHKEEFWLVVPIPVGRGGLLSAAFPYLVDHASVRTACAVEGDGQRAEALEVANFDSMVGADFKARLPLIIAQEILSSAGKAAATYAASAAAASQSNGGSAAALVAIFGMVYQAASTAADLRSWRTMPKRIFVTQIPTPASGVVRVLSDGASLCEIAVQPACSNLVVVTAPGATATSWSAPLTPPSVPAPATPRRIINSTPIRAVPIG